MRKTTKAFAFILSMSMVIGMFALTAAAAEEVNLKINFSSETSRGYPDGYLNDLGAEFGDRGNGHKYGWNEDHAGRARDRGDTLKDRRLDTIIQVAEGGSWKIEVPDGTYQVEVALTDASYGLDKPAYLYVNGVPYVEDQKTSLNDPTLVVKNEVTVDNGVIEFTVGPAVEEGTKLAYTHIDSIELDTPAENPSNNGDDNEDAATPDMPKTGLGGTDGGANGTTWTLLALIAILVAAVAYMRMRKNKTD